MTVPAAEADGPGVLRLDSRVVDVPTRLVVTAEEPSGDGATPMLQVPMLQVVVKAEHHRRQSLTSVRPSLVLLPGDHGDARYEIELRNHSSAAATVQVRLFEEDEPNPLELRFNQPDCGPRCQDEREIADPTDPSNGLRAAVVDAIQGARRSIDFAVYGLDDPAIEESLCNAARAGVRVRVVTDWRTLDPEDNRGYYEALAALARCIDPDLPRDRDLGDEDFAERGIEFVKHGQIMHHKFLVVDEGSRDALLVTGSTNFTASGLDLNHNHLLFIRKAPGLIGAYAREFAQLHEHCRHNTDWRGRPCDECTATCVANVGFTGPWLIEDPEAGPVEVQVYFSPAAAGRSREVDPVEVLRGPAASREFRVSKRGREFCVVESRGPAEAREQFVHECTTSPSDEAADLERARQRAKDAADRRKLEPDPACVDQDASCVCHRAGSGRYSCDYCGGPSGADFGLMSDARDRVLMSLFAATDRCFGVAAAYSARDPATRAVAIYDRVNAAGAYARDDYMCARGFETYVDDWSGKSAVVFNHNKTVVIDDVVFDGSMNISASGAGSNNENTLVLRGRGIADAFTRYIEAEAGLLERRAIEREMVERCEKEPVSEWCEDLAERLERAREDDDGRDLGDLQADHGRCLALDAEWASRCAHWQADPGQYLQDELARSHTQSLYDNPRPLRECTCNDGVDNDGDGRVDQDEPGCGESDCFDEEDNDGDGLIDAIDPDCAGPGEPSA